MDIAKIRKEYTKKRLEISLCPDDPFDLSRKWIEEAISAQIEEPTAMTLATASKEGRPSSRIVLLKETRSASFVFFTNYKSRKGRQLAQNPFASLSFFWKELERQIHIEGAVRKISIEDSDSYFASRPYLSKIGAWASRQSEELSSHKSLQENFEALKDRYPDQVPRPAHWGGYELLPARIEFWQGRPSRLHDRVLYTKGDEVWKKVLISS